MTHICVGKLTIIGSDNGLSPGRRQAIIWINAAILLIGPLGTNFNEILIEIQTFWLKKIRLKMSSAKCFSFRLGLNVLKHTQRYATLSKNNLLLLPWFVIPSHVGRKTYHGWNTTHIYAYIKPGQRVYNHMLKGRSLYLSLTTLSIQCWFRPEWHRGQQILPSFLRQSTVLYSWINSSPYSKYMHII